MLLEGRDQRVGARHEDAGVPQEALVDEIPRPFRIRLLVEGGDGAGIALPHRRAGLDIAVAGMGAGRADADERDGIRGGGQRGRLRKRRGKGCRILDEMVGGLHDQHGTGILAGNDESGGRNRRGGVARHRLQQQQPRAAGFLQRGAREESVVLAGHQQGPFRAGNRRRALDRLRQQAPVRAECQELLGMVAPAERPQPRSGAAAQNDRPDACLAHFPLCSPNARQSASFLPISPFQARLATFPGSRRRRAPIRRSGDGDSFVTAPQNSHQAARTGFPYGGRNGIQNAIATLQETFLISVASLVRRAVVVGLLSLSKESRCKLKTRSLQRSRRIVRSSCRP